ncbi:unnamed protein product, partial [Symbiodinium pilosum]
TWCCQHEKRACDKYNCEGGFNTRYTTWSNAKQEYCCQKYGYACGSDSGDYGGSHSINTVHNVGSSSHSGGGFSHTETFGDLPPGFKMEGGKWVYKGGHVEVSGSSKLPPGFHMKGGKIVYGHGSHTMSLPEGSFHSQGGHVVFSDASGAAGSASVSHTAHGGGTFSHTETFGDMPPGFKMEGGKMVYSKSGHFDFSGDGKLPPGFHMKGGKVVYGHGSHAMSFPESDFHSQGGHVVFNTGQKH